jgi:tetratricopeptide (TPR) repeat protein
VDPTNRRGILSVAAGAALGAGAVRPAPARAREIDPGLVDHWTNLLNLLGQHNQAFGPRLVRDAVRRELRLIAEHRAAACGELRVALMGVEAFWSEFGSWLAHDCGDRRERDVLLNRALYLAREAGYQDMLAWVHARLADWSDAPVALRHAEAGLRTPGAGAHARAMCATRVAYAHACIGAAEAAERSIAEAERLAAEDSRPLPPPSSGMTALLVRRWEANCWAVLKPARAIELYDAILRDQPRAWVGGHGLYLAYLANACADAGELDRARAEGGRALAIAKQTKSTTAARELKRLQAALKAA